MQNLIQNIMLRAYNNIGHDIGYAMLLIRDNARSQRDATFFGVFL